MSCGVRWSAGAGGKGASTTLSCVVRRMKVWVDRSAHAPFLEDLTKAGSTSAPDTDPGLPWPC